MLKPLQELFGRDTSSGVDGQFHFINLFINFLHKMYYKVNDLEPIHGLGVKVGDQERHIITGGRLLAIRSTAVLGVADGRVVCTLAAIRYWLAVRVDGRHWLATKYDKIIRSHHQESRELVHEYAFNVIGLFDGDRYAHRVDRRLDQYTFFLIPTDYNRIQYELFATSHFNFRLIVTFDHL